MQGRILIAYSAYAFLIEQSLTKREIPSTLKNAHGKTT